MCRKVWQSDFVQEADQILVYAARGDELETRPLIRRLIKNHKAVFLPRMEGGNVRIYQVKNLKKDIQRGAYGILEPQKKAARLGNMRCIQVAVIPGLGFTRNGVRLGRGGGHFDRLLAGADHVVKIGIGYREQILKKIPSSRHDVCMNFVVTD